MSQPFILNDERLMGQLNHRMPVAAEKGVEGGATSPLIILSLGDEAKDKGSDLTKTDPCRQSKDFNFNNNNNNNNNNNKKGFLCSHPEVGVPFKVSKKEKKKKIS